MKGAWTRWIVGTAAWAIGACVVVAVIWGPDPVALVVTAAISVAISVLIGNGNER